ncbi:hypothetical protein EON64_19200, partial [archaeon]
MRPSQVLSSVNKTDPPVPPKTTIKSKNCETPLHIKPKVIDSLCESNKSEASSKKKENESSKTTNKVPKPSCADDEDSEDEDEATAEKAQKAHHNAMFATKLGAGVNVFLAVVKGGLGVSISSTALIADAASSLGDIASDAVVYFTV